ncbi:MAG: GTP-binding protein [Alphaproteobacteria bacterium]|nr:GTP-binding protein [Alphaproteobacteria bacterium]
MQAQVSLRSPIVVIVGHIDHGKSTLLDAIRHTDTQRKEAGGITQHISAYQIHTTYEGTDRSYTVLDTPGHYAFQDVRASGVGIADIALLIVSAEEGPKDQTKEALRTIQEYNKKFIVVITKCNTEKANVEKTKADIASIGIFLEGWGGDIPFVCVSAKEGMGLNDLSSAIILHADVYELTKHTYPGSPEILNGESPVGVVVDTQMNNTIGLGATIIVTNEHIRTGIILLAEDGAICSVRGIVDAYGNSLKEAYPSSPVIIHGFDTQPMIQSKVYACTSKKDAEKKKLLLPEKKYTEVRKMTDKKVLIPVILKSDTSANISSLIQTIEAKETDRVYYKVIQHGVGEITPTDAQHARAHPLAVVIAFHTSLNPIARHALERDGILIQQFDTIYALTDWLSLHVAHETKKNALQLATGSGKIIRIFKDDGVRGIYIVGVEIIHGTCNTGSVFIIMREEKEVGVFTITSIEQHSKKVNTITGEGEQIACELHGEGTLTLNDLVYCTTL